jgi:hypothetical protein
MIGSLMKLMLTVFAVGASGTGKLRIEERAIYHRAFCERRRSMEAANTAQAAKEVRRAS